MPQIIKTVHSKSEQEDALSEIANLKAPLELVSYLLSNATRGKPGVCQSRLYRHKADGSLEIEIEESP